MPKTPILCQPRIPPRKKKAHSMSGLSTRSKIISIKKYQITVTICDFAIYFPIIFTSRKTEMLTVAKYVQHFIYSFFTPFPTNNCSIVISSSKDPHGELIKQNVLIVYGSVDETADHFGCTVEDVKKYLSESLKILFQVRASRPRPHLDDKIVTAWNGKLFISLNSVISTHLQKILLFVLESSSFQ